MMTPVPEGGPAAVPQGSSGGRIVRLIPYIFTATLVFTTLLQLAPSREDDTVATLLRGPDDFMRLVQVIDWLDGQGWSDLVQRRLNPPDGVAMHWSRLADIPVAGVIWLTEPWFDRARAVYLSALLVPPFLGGLFSALFVWAALPLVPDRRSLVPLLMIGTLIAPLFQFNPGRVDHHGLQLVLTVLSMGLLIRALEPGRFRAAVGLGVAGGTSLAIGLETLPFLGAATVILSLVWVGRGGTTATSLALFGVAATGTTLVLIPLTLPRSVWTTILCDRLSLAHVAMTAIVLAAGVVAVAVARWRPRLVQPARLVIVGGVGLAGLVLAAAAFPQCTGNPYAHLSAEIRYWFDAVNEARSLLALFPRNPGLAIAIIVLPLAALVSLAFRWIRATDRADPHGIALLVLVLSGGALAAWQVRGMTYAGLVASLALIPLVAAVNERADRARWLLVRVGLRFCVPMLCIVAFVAPQQLLKPAANRTADGQESECEVRPVLTALTDPTALGAEARTIVAPIDLGPSILLLTRHSVLAAPYHRNTRGLTDHRRIFAGTEEEALATIRARAVDAILFCREFAWITTYAGQPAFLSERLDAGRPPWWLIPLMHNEEMSLYRIHPEARAMG